MVEKTTEMKLDPLTLADKGNSGIKDLLSNSYEYLISRISAEYCNTVLGSDLAEEFNNKNDITFSKAIVYPFFVAISNGHSESLFNLFGEFYPLDFGPVSLSLMDLYKEEISSEHSHKYFKYFDVFEPAKSLGIQVINKSFKNIEGITKDIRLQGITVNSDTCRLEDVCIRSDKGSYNSICDAIDSSIEAIKLQSRKTFFTSNSQDLMRQAGYAMKNAYDLNRKSVIDFKRLDKAESRPYYNAELIF